MIRRRKPRIASTATGIVGNATLNLNTIFLTSIVSNNTAFSVCSTKTGVQANTKSSIRGSVQSAARLVVASAGFLRVIGSTAAQTLSRISAYSSLTNMPTRLASAVILLRTNISSLTINKNAGNAEPRLQTTISSVMANKSIFAANPRLRPTIETVGRAYVRAETTARLTALIGAFGGMTILPLRIASASIISFLKATALARSTISATASPGSRFRFSSVFMRAPRRTAVFSASLDEIIVSATMEPCE